MHYHVGAYNIHINVDNYQSNDINPYTIQQPLKHDLKKKTQLKRKSQTNLHNKKNTQECYVVLYHKNGFEPHHSWAYPPTQIKISTTMFTKLVPN